MFRWIETRKTKQLVRRERLIYFLELKNWYFRKFWKKKIEIHRTNSIVPKRTIETIEKNFIFDERNYLNEHYAMIKNRRSNSIDWILLSYAYKNEYFWDEWISMKNDWDMKSDEFCWKFSSEWIIELNNQSIFCLYPVQS